MRDVLAASTMDNTAERNKKFIWLPSERTFLAGGTSVLQQSARVGLQFGLVMNTGNSAVLLTAFPCLRLSRVPFLYTPMFMRVFVILPAAGLGTRMAAGQHTPSAPKQFLELAGVPILIHSLRTFAQVPQV